jgi:hypothetical protein
MTEGDKKEMDQHYLDAGWHPPVKTRLRVVIKEAVMTHESSSGLLSGSGCATRTLTKEEMVEGYEKAIEELQDLYSFEVVKNLKGYDLQRTLTLASGATIILVGGNDVPPG